MKTGPILPSKDECYGCTSCEQICPRQCISMVSDDEGFLYPKVDNDACIGCKRCEKSCPSLAKLEDCYPIKTYAAINTEENIRSQSSSGGVFTLLAEAVINQGGIVFGARFDELWQVIHAKAEKVEDLSSFRGSKYVQSKMGNCYAEAQEYLKQGRIVMFVGTPCQIAGLHRFLGKPYEKLLTVDFICHGVPSPAVWQWYIDRKSSDIAGKSLKGRFYYWRNSGNFVNDVEFRDKTYGWKQFSMVIKTKGKTYSEKHFNDSYMKAFLNNYSLRLSCYSCKMKYGRSHSDITIADFWNVHKVTELFDDDKGTSLVLANSSKGLKLFQQLHCKSKEVDFSDAIQYNRAWSIPYAKNENRDYFFKHYREQLETIVNSVHK